MNYIHRLKYLSSNTRAILIDWLIDVAAECTLENVTLSSAVGLVDRCLAICEYRQCVDLEDVDYGSSEEESDYGNESEEDDRTYASGYVSHGGNMRKRNGFGSHGKLIIGANTLQLLGCGCMMIASKIHDVKPMKAEKFTYLSADSFSESQIVTMEKNICSALRFHLQIVTPSHFVLRYLRASHVSGNQYHHHGDGTSGSNSCLSPPPPCSFLWNEDRLRYIVDYLLEIAMLEIEFVAMKPSLVAASAVYLARAMLDIRDRNHSQAHGTGTSNDATDTNIHMDSQEDHDTLYGYYFSHALTHYTGYNVKSIVHVVMLLHHAHKKATTRSSTLNAVRDKYSSAKCKYVALTAPVDRKSLFPESLVENNYFSESEVESSDDSDVNDSDDDVSDIGLQTQDSIECDSDDE